MECYIKKLGDSDEEDVIFIRVQDKITKNKSFIKMYKVSQNLYRTYLDSHLEIVKFGTNESHNNFILI